jgi:hypothetical protein
MVSGPGGKPIEVNRPLADAKPDGRPQPLHRLPLINATPVE